MILPGQRLYLQEWGANKTAETETMGREYKDLEEFNRDARKLAEKGWSVQSVTERTQNAGCFRCCFLGIFSSVLNPQPHIVVTHVREKAS